MKFKAGVRIYKFLKAESMLILQTIQDTAPEGYEPTITSANDSKHGDDSKHYEDCGFDIRTRDYPGFDLKNFEETQHVVHAWIVRMRKRLLTIQYDIIFGDKKHRDHIHIEFDPK